MKTRMLCLFVIGLLANTVVAEKPWKLDAQDQWVQATSSSEHISMVDGPLRSTQPTSRFTSTIRSYQKKRSAKSITFKQTTAWDNWKHCGPVSTKAGGEWI